MYNTEVINISKYGLRDNNCNFNVGTFNTVEVTERMYGSGMVNSASGTIKYVDASNSISGDGNSWNAAYLTILEATAALRDDYSDDAESYIFIAPGSYVETDELRMYGHGMHLIGLGHPGTDSGVNMTDTATGVTTGIILIGGANCTIENIEFLSTKNISAICLIASDNCYIQNNVFKGTSGTTVSAITGIDVRSTYILNNQIGEAGCDFTNGIYFSGGSDYYCIDSYIAGNRIYSDNTSGRGILIDNTCTTYGNVFDRNFINVNGTSGKGIDNNSTGVNIYCDNFVVVASGATPIESASSPTGMIGNHTMAGATVVDPNTVAG